MLVVWAAIKTREFSRTFIFLMIITIMIIDTAAYCTVIIHDVPSYALNIDFLANEMYYVSVLIQCLQWFTQLLFLPVFSIVHFMAIFSPMTFRTLSQKHFLVANIAVLTLGLLLT
ncbi:unnamed protein product, partial [Strongylus vulgaris]